MGFISLFNSLFFPSHIFNPVLLELHLSTPSVICFPNYHLKLTVSQSPKANRLISVYWSHLHREMHHLHPKNLQFKVKWKQQADRNRKENMFKEKVQQPFWKALKYLQATIYPQLESSSTQFEMKTWDNHYSFLVIWKILKILQSTTQDSVLEYRHLGWTQGSQRNLPPPFIPPQLFHPGRDRKKTLLPHFFLNILAVGKKVWLYTTYPFLPFLQPCISEWTIRLKALRDSINIWSALISNITSERSLHLLLFVCCYLSRDGFSWEQKQKCCSNNQLRLILATGCCILMGRERLLPLC